jgi:hypothetical protein
LYPDQATKNNNNTSDYYFDYLFREPLKTLEYIALGIVNTINLFKIQRFIFANVLDYLITIQ